MLTKLIKQIVRVPEPAKTRLEMEMREISEENKEDVLKLLTLHFPQLKGEQLNVIRHIIKLIINNLPAESYRNKENTDAMIYHTAAFVCYALLEFTCAPMLPDFIEAFDFIEKSKAERVDNRGALLYCYIYDLAKYLGSYIEFQEDEKLSTYRDLDFDPKSPSDFLKLVYAYSWKATWWELPDAYKIPRGGLRRGLNTELFEHALYIATVTGQVTPIVTEWSKNPFFATPLDERDDEDYEPEWDDSFYGNLLNAEEMIDFFGEKNRLERDFFRLDEDYEKILTFKASWLLRFVLGFPCSC